MTRPVQSAWAWPVAAESSFGSAGGSASSAAGSFTCQLVALCYTKVVVTEIVLDCLPRWQLLRSFLTASVQCVSRKLSFSKKQQKRQK